MKKERIKRSIVWSISTKEFNDLVKQSINIAQICRHFGLGHKGGNYSTIKRRIAKENISTVHFKNQYSLKFNWVSKEEFLLKLSSYKDLAWIKKKIIEFDLIKQECQECQIKDMWNNKPIILHLDHINGNSRDNRLENFRFLCPNCHSQTETYSRGQKKKLEYHCIDCRTKISRKQIRCKPCGDKQRRKPNRPTKEELERLVQIFLMTKIGEKYGVSDNAVRKWCKVENINF